MPSRLPWLMFKNGFLFWSLAAAVAVTVVLVWTKTHDDLDFSLVHPAPETVVLQIDSSEDPAMQLAAAWRELQLKPTEAKTSGRFAETALRHYALSGNPRFLGYAEGALTQWQDETQPPLEIWLLRGRLLQTQHRYAEAGHAMDDLLQVHGESAEGLLLATDAWRRAGNLGRARARCAQIALAGWLNLAVSCTADILLSLGQAEKAWQLVSSGSAAAGGEPSETDQWTYAVAADTAAAAGHTAEARAFFQRALAIPGAGIALHAAYADLLLSDGHPEEALEVLDGLPDADAVLLRRVMAAKLLDAGNFEELRTRLRSRFAEAESLGTNSLHLREQALFSLHIEDEPHIALALAGENWKLQKGWEDAELFLRAARAAGRPEAASAVQDWRRQYAMNPR